MRNFFLNLLGTATNFNSLVFVMLVVAVFISQPSFAGSEYYRWTDENGVSHFTSVPPPDKSAEKLKANIHSGDPTSNTKKPAKKSPTDKAKTPQEIQQAAADAKRCAAERKRLSQLNSGSRIRMESKDGELHYLDEGRINAEIAKSRQAISESCK